MAAPIDLELEKVKEGLEHAEASLRKVRGLWARISDEAIVLQKKGDSRDLGNGCTES